jgi:hypothetical protein
MGLSAGFLDEETIIATDYQSITGHGMDNLQHYYCIASYKYLIPCYHSGLGFIFSKQSNQWTNVAELTVNNSIGFGTWSAASNDTVFINGYPGHTTDGRESTNYPLVMCLSVAQPI